MVLPKRSDAHAAPASFAALASAAVSVRSGARNRNANVSDFMPSGILPADAAGILNSRRMSELIADVKNRFDLVLIDSPPIRGETATTGARQETSAARIMGIARIKLPKQNRSYL